jgi:hypothetical protein
MSRWRIVTTVLVLAAVVAVHVEGKMAPGSEAVDALSLLSDFVAKHASTIVEQPVVDKAEIIEKLRMSLDIAKKWSDHEAMSSAVQIVSEKSTTSSGIVTFLLDKVQYVSELPFGAELLSAALVESFVLIGSVVEIESARREIHAKSFELQRMKLDFSQVRAELMLAHEDFSKFESQLAHTKFIASVDNFLEFNTALNELGRSRKNALWRLQKLKSGDLAVKSSNLRLVVEEQISELRNKSLLFSNLCIENNIESGKAYKYCGAAALGAVLTSQPYFALSSVVPLWLGRYAIAKGVYAIEESISGWKNSYISHLYAESSDDFQSFQQTVAQSLSDLESLPSKFIKVKSFSHLFEILPQNGSSTAQHVLGTSFVLVKAIFPTELLVSSIASVGITVYIYALYKNSPSWMRFLGKFFLHLAGILLVGFILQFCLSYFQAYQEHFVAISVARVQFDEHCREVDYSSSMLRFITRTLSGRNAQLIRKCQQWDKLISSKFSISSFAFDVFQQAIRSLTSLSSSILSEMNAASLIWSTFTFMALVCLLLKQRVMCVIFVVLQASFLWITTVSPIEMMWRFFS